MALKGTWKNKVDGVDPIFAQDINSIAQAVIALEAETGSIEDALDSIIEMQNSLIGGDGA